MSELQLMDLLRNKDLRASPQRIEILRYLAEDNDHPTVDTIYLSLKDKIPSLSRTTVYNTLWTFVDSGLASVVRIEGGEARFDVLVEEHGHFYCNRCGRIFDFKLADGLKALKSGELKNFQIIEQDVVLKGICVNCRTMDAPDK